MDPVLSGVSLLPADLYPFLNTEHVITETARLTMQSKDEVLKNLLGVDGDIVGFMLDTYQVGGLAEMISLLDDTDILDCSIKWSDDSCKPLVVYLAKLPWELTDKDPRSLEELCDIYYNAVSRICDISKEDLATMIRQDDGLFYTF